MPLFRTILFVKDMATMLAFYEELLGFKEIQTPDTGPDWRVLDTGGAELALHAVPARVARELTISDPAEPRTNAVTKLVYAVDDVVAARGRLRQAGVLEVIHGGFELGEPPPFWDFQDPEGNLLQITSR
ncbi:MAG: VOC family protein [Pseudomonadota bacterium]